MKPKTKAALLLLVLSPAMGELLSGSMPPLEFLNPVRFFLIVCLYGCGTLLIREARVRWNLQWSVILIAAAYGILEEGTIVKSFFNPGWVDMNKLSAYGMYGGVQWPWAIMLTFYHATISTLIPITIVDHIWPECRHSPFLGRNGLRCCAAGLTFITVLGGIFFGTIVNGENIPFYPDIGIWIASAALVIGLTLLAKALPGRIMWDAPLLPPWALVLFAFLIQAANLIVPNVLSENGIPGSTSIIWQLVLVSTAVLLALSQVYNLRTTPRHLSALVLGSVLTLSAIAPINEYANGAFGMTAVGIIGLLLTLRWRRKYCSQTAAIQAAEPTDL